MVPWSGQNLVNSLWEALSTPFRAWLAQHPLMFWLASHPRANAYKSTYLNKHQFWPLYCEWSHQSELITKKVDCFSVV